MRETDYLGADRLSALGDTAVLVVDACRWRKPIAPVQAIVIGIDREGTLPAIDEQAFDVLLTVCNGAPRPWLSLEPENFDKNVAKISAAAEANPIAATIGAQILRLASGLNLRDALQVESLAYSTLLGGTEFRRWQDTTKRGAPIAVSADPVVFLRDGNQITLKLNNPQNRNAMSATMRDALYEALANILDDPTKPEVILTGEGKCFSTGGSLPEFGTAHDLAAAHVTRSLHSCATALDALGDRAAVRFHGACIGSGIEIGAAAYRRIATPEAWFQLPELDMGLIPGAGGTATIARAIGRHRTMWMFLSGKRIGASQALEWGLVHVIENQR